MNEELPELKVICPFCNAVHPLEIESELFDGCGGCDTCSTDDPTGNLEVRCFKCKKVIYRKEI